MKGTILDFSPETGIGMISAGDGGRYSFDTQEWKGSGPARAGMAIDFVIEGDKALAVYPDVSVTGTSSKKIAAALFALFLGAFGAHKFYLGYTKQGVIMLAVFLLGFLLLGLPSMVISIIAFVEFILYLIKSDTEFEQTYVTGNRPWF